MCETYCKEQLLKMQLLNEFCPMGTKRPSPHQTTEQGQDINVKGAGTPHRHLLTAKADGRSVYHLRKTGHNFWVVQQPWDATLHRDGQNWYNPKPFLSELYQLKTSCKSPKDLELLEDNSKTGDNVSGVNFSPYSPNLDGGWGSSSPGTLSWGRTAKRKWGKIPAESKFYSQICS